MSTIPIHTFSPINHHNYPYASLTRSPSSAAARYTPQSPTHIDARPTTATPGPSPSPRHGPLAFSLPTNTSSAADKHNVSPLSTPTITPAPTPTRSIGGSNPPAPQPGAVPVPLDTTSPTNPSITIPPRSRPGDRSMKSPNQLSVSPKSANSIRHSLPSPTPTPTRPTWALHQPAGVDLSHPPGYIQDHRASFDDKPVEFCQAVGRRASASSRRGGILDGEPTMEDDDEDNTVFNQAMAWAKAAGKRLSMTEEQIWRSLNGDGKYHSGC